MSYLKLRAYQQDKDDLIEIGSRELHSEIPNIGKNIKSFFFDTLSYAKANILTSKEVDLGEDDMRLSPEERQQMTESLLFSVEDEHGEVLFEMRGDKKVSVLCDKIEELLSENIDEKQKNDHTKDISSNMPMPFNF